MDIHQMLLPYDDFAYKFITTNKCDIFKITDNIAFKIKTGTVDKNTININGCLFVPYKLYGHTCYSLFKDLTGKYCINLWSNYNENHHDMYVPRKITLEMAKMYIVDCRYLFFLNLTQKEKAILKLKI